MVWVNPAGHRGQAWGETDGNTLKIDCSRAGTYLALIVGTRCDEGARSDWTGAEIEKKIELIDNLTSKIETIDKYFSAEQNEVITEEKE